jgi:hypothetical protein
MENWYVPITIIPGVGLLILSTSNLLVELSHEIKTLISEKNKSNLLIKNKLRQLKLLNAAMVFLYLSVASLVISGLTSGLYLSAGLNFKASIYITILGIIFVLAGLLTLVVYSFKAVKIRQNQFKEILNG